MEAKVESSTAFFIKERKDDGIRQVFPLSQLWIICIAKWTFKLIQNLKTKSGLVLYICQLKPSWHMFFDTWNFYQCNWKWKLGVSKNFVLTWKSLSFMYSALPKSCGHFSAKSSEIKPVPSVCMRGSPLSSLIGRLFPSYNRVDNRARTCPLWEDEGNCS